MMGRNRIGVQMAANGYRRSVVARGFFEMFYRWSRVGCSGAGAGQRRNLSSPVHSKTRLSQQLPKWPPISSRIQARRESTLSQEQTEEAGDGAVAVPKPEPESSTTTDEKPRAENPKAPPPPEPPLSTALRKTMRSLPHPVVLLTTSNLLSCNITRPHPFCYRAMTVSSLTTVSLFPSPIISFNIRLPSQTYQTLSYARNFFIHILAASPVGARLADLFTRGGGGVEAFRGILGSGGKAEGEDKGKEIKVIEHEVVWHEPRKIMLPRIEADGVVKVLRCRLTQSYPIGDHRLVLGEVMEVLGETGGDGEVAVSGLGYVDGKYRGLGDVIELKSGKDV